jgi:predicted alpha/beta superfamily hydrolase
VRKRIALDRLSISCLLTVVIGFFPLDQRALTAELKPGEEVVWARQYSIHSEILGEDRSMLVHLPESYALERNRDRRYPVLYLLDGPAYFNATTGIVYHLSDNAAAVERIPELIVVAVRNIRTSALATRNRDMTPSHMASGLYSENSGGAGTFRAFLEKELIPQIDSVFRTQNERILVGHSLAGLFTLDTLVEKPRLFTAYIAIDPSASWDGNLLARKLMSRAPTRSGSSVKLFIAEANSTYMTEAEREARREGIQSFRSALKEWDRSVQDHYRYFSDETHLSVPLIGIYTGLLSVYDDYKRP